MKRLFELFVTRTTDRSTLDELLRMIDDRDTWQKAHDLFQNIRVKNLAASKRGDGQLEAQYCFEEVCAKTLYNLSCSPAPFDVESPYWIVPNALVAGRNLGIDEKEVIRAISTVHAL